ncbi:expansin-a13 [Phtheirospermum japonicum]|uniref:Expansin-a13 n=1 Tax=Phtheirospermum japonicum TaxID=374723 RepID=A0A830BDP2_9LAMI|nr:expansin-a13 [Phtheirospermum japonicum]
MSLAVLKLRRPDEERWQYVGGSAILSYDGSGGGSILGLTSGSVVALTVGGRLGLKMAAFKEGVLLVKGNCRVGCNSPNAHFVLTIEAFEKIAILKCRKEGGFRFTIGGAGIFLSVLISIAAGELNVYCTQLDHLDESWRIKQINVMIQSNDQPHILARGLNSLDASDYSSERWNNIVKSYEELGKPSPKVEVTNFLKGRECTDAKSFPGECVQGICKYGTRVDYIMGSPGLSYKFVPGSYSVFSSKGTSDHHIVKVDIVKVANDAQIKSAKRRKRIRQRFVRLTYSCSSTSFKGISS